ncbi:hypothetical protein AXF42_Ash000590 [Apostasia shenzhenica]|uniref:Uncharacterized protein n=1 Tax=Apostasia shenzhenica TaxID=1088818 RepID=A0A2I0AGW4_9ASPA|nr:hypothetical protein AXF42_Ash000590 [Apostasia shenzhenica]
MFGASKTSCMTDVSNSPSHIEHNVSQLYLSLSACSGHTVSNAACFFQTHKPRARMLQPLQVPIRHGPQEDKLFTHCFQPLQWPTAVGPPAWAQHCLYFFPFERPGRSSPSTRL